MNYKPDQAGPNSTKRTKRLGALLGLVGVIYRLLIIVGLILLVLATLSILFTSLFSLWFLALPLSLIALGVLLAWFEFQLHGRYYAQQSNDVSRDDEQEKDQGNP